MKPYTFSKEKSLPFYQKYDKNILAFILALFSLPVAFSYSVDTTLDASWVRALNLAIKNKLVFGRDLVFTYGPLAYFSTRNSQYIPDISLFLADIFLFSCFYYVSFLILSKSKNWFFILLVSIFYFKGYEYTATIFLFFIVFSILNLRNNFKNYFEVATCAVCSVVAFFVKVNFGLISLPIAAILVIVMLFRNRKALLVFLTVYLVVYLFIYENSSIDVIFYVKNSIPMISYYNEAMIITADVGGTPFRCAIIYILLFLCMILFYFWRTNDENKVENKVYTACVLFLMLFLSYKNGFTRADNHIDIFFYMLPLFTVFSMFLFEFTSKKARVICIMVIFLSDLNVNLPHSAEGKGFINHNTFFYTLSYFKTLFKKQADREPGELKIPGNKLKVIGNNTIDVFPVDVSLAQLNNLNYNPRPIMQSYSAYSPLLDSLNADHFYMEKRPQMAMIRIESIDARYEAWDESLTKAVLHLNYNYYDFVSLNNDTTLNNNKTSYLLLKSKSGTKNYPIFEKLYDTTINFEDTAHFDFPDNLPTYMTANMQYTGIGRIRSIAFQGPVVYTSLFLNNECTVNLHYRAIPSIIRAPVLISNAMCDNLDFKNFMDGKIMSNAKIKAFVFHSDGWGYDKKIKLTFYKWVNY